MTAARKKAARIDTPFDPATGEVLDDEFEWQTGRHRKPARVPSIDLDWPEGAAARKAAFDAWHQIAMQILQKGRISFRLIAVFWRFVNWKTGTIYPSNITLAAVAGRCSERTVTRELAQYEAAGIIRSRLHRKRKNNGAYTSVRLIILTVPKDMETDVQLTDAEPEEDENEDFSLDNSGLPRTAVSLDSSGLGEVDSSGLVTLEVTQQQRNPDGTA